MLEDHSPQSRAASFYYLNKRWFNSVMGVWQLHHFRYSPHLLYSTHFTDVCLVIQCFICFLDPLFQASSVNQAPVTWLKRRQDSQLFCERPRLVDFNDCIEVCFLKPRMPSPLNWEDFICHSFCWCWCNEQVCGWWMAWPFTPLYNQVFLVQSYD